MKFCPTNCHWLSLTEFEQDKQKTHRDDHWCNRHNKRLYHLDAHPSIYKCEECTMSEYTLMWTVDDGRMLQHTVIAEDKYHALSLALSNTMINIILFDYLLQFEKIDAQIQQFLWLRNGRIC